ncbi:hypothetical protein [Psychrobacter immobilis]|uniref:hypothetical protein n=1 Tax=Psychrobacter immobilis TaxID=498 RepID=UPI00191884E3|nr:hypothetical protein [Psychrobacter immobilis]
MSMIDQLEKTVTPAVLGDSDIKDNVAYVSLLEQFYAILAARLAVPQVYSQLIRTDEVIAASRATEISLFEQLWQDQQTRQVIVQELATTHHIDTSTTLQLLINAAPLAYRELKILANGQFLPAFLQAEQAALRPYLPIWSAPIIIVTDANTVPMVDTVLGGMHQSIPSTSAIAASTASYVENIDIVNTNIKSADIANNDIESRNVESRHLENTETHFGDNTDAIHVNPSAHHWAENSSMKHEKVRTRNQRNDLLIRVFLLIVAIAALGLAAWAILTRPNSVPLVEPVVTEPVVVAPLAPPAQVMTPVELIVGVDNSGSLYTCSGTIGDEALQSTLQQALNTSFGEQASICELTVQAGIANSIANIPTEALSNILTLLRPIPFARLHLQNDRLILEAPDNLLLQRLATDIRTLAPTMTIDSVAPLPLPNTNGDTANNMSGMNGVNNQFDSNANVVDNAYNNDGYSNNANSSDGNVSNNGAGAGEYQAGDDNTGDSVMPAPARNNPVRSNNGNLTNIPRNSSSNGPTNNRPSGPISQSEVDDMASSVIVAEPAQVR